MVLSRNLVSVLSIVILIDEYSRGCEVILGMLAFVAYQIIINIVIRWIAVCQTVAPLFLDVVSKKRPLSCWLSMLNKQKKMCFQASFDFHPDC
jgi:hypothetical protein